MRFRALGGDGFVKWLRWYNTNAYLDSFPVLCVPVVHVKTCKMDDKTWAVALVRDQKVDMVGVSFFDLMPDFGQAILNHFIFANKTLF